MDAPYQLMMSEEKTDFDVDEDSPYQLTMSEEKDIDVAEEPELPRMTPDQFTVFERHAREDIAVLWEVLRSVRKDVQQMKSAFVQFTGEQIPDHQPAIPVELPEDLNLPLSSVEDVTNLESRLVDDDQLEQSLTTSLSGIGGTNIWRLVKCILQCLMTDSCAQNYNWKGQMGDKLPFQPLRLCRLVTNAVKKNEGTQSAAHSEIEQKIKFWLKVAKERDCGRKEREKMKKREDIQEAILQLNGGKDKIMSVDGRGKGWLEKGQGGDEEKGRHSGGDSTA
ncbi:uncharacterized protein LOC143274809 [Babylonia areolata]|uniref:uncharacterized protein LOC143274809 n=1 Tax=Babylonia areolata TaxID=304850 RepID=UPI003FD4C0B2